MAWYPRPTEYDPHEGCRMAIRRAYEDARKLSRIEAVIKRHPNGNFDILQVIGVEQTASGLYVMVG